MSSTIASDEAKASYRQRIQLNVLRARRALEQFH